MKIERGVMVVKNGMGWGLVYEDGYSTEYGWVQIEDAELHDPEFCKKTTDVTYRNSPYAKELMTAQLVMVERRTEVTILEPGDI